VKVPRNTHITLNYRDKGFKLNTVELYGSDARVVQHEIDHLNGKLITDYK
jgi:peptide deformylase